MRFVRDEINASLGAPLQTETHVLDPSSVPWPMSYYPHPAVLGDDLWVVQVHYDPHTTDETLCLVDVRTGQWHVVADGASAIIDPACVVVDDGTLWIAWVEGPEFRVVARHYDPERNRLGRLMPISNPQQRCASLEVRRHGTGARAVWEAWRDDATNTIEMASMSSEDHHVALTGALTPYGGVAYWPSTEHDGERTWLAWCTPNSAHDGYDAYVATFMDPFSMQSPATVARLNSDLGGNFHLYPKLTLNGDGTVWVSWLASTAVEYYDGTSLPGNSDFAYLQDARSRRLRNVWWKSCVPVVARLTVDGDTSEAWFPGKAKAGPLLELGHGHYPTLLSTDKGVPLLAFRRITPNLLFETVVSRCTEAGWSVPASVHHAGLQTGRNGPIRSTVGADGRMCAVALQVHRVAPDDSFRWKPPDDSTTAVVEISWAGDASLAPVPDPLTRRVLKRESIGTAVSMEERDNQSAVVARKGVYFGNIHVHSELSGCRRDTQQSVDFNYRWAKDLMGQDFHALTDHAEHLSDYDWRTTQTAAHFYDFPGAFVAIAAYEWTVNDFGARAHSGHCNVLLRGDERHAYGSDEETTSTLPGLWQALPEGDAITIPHHTATFPYLRDWRLHDARFERLVEVHQDRRGNYEYSGCPGEYGRAAPLQAREHNVEGGFVSDALDQGYRLGLCAGGDHMGISMTGIPAAALTRDAIFDALLERRCFGVTGARIELDLVVRCGGTTAGMGEVLTVSGSAEVEVAVGVEGTGPLHQIELISGGKAIRSCAGSGSEGQDCSFLLARGETVGYIYVRVVQEDGEMAWSSPIWLAPSPH